MAGCGTHEQGEDVPDDECCEVARRLVGYEFPWDVARSLELGLLKTFGSPRISTLLDATGEMACCTQKRYDDTNVLMTLMIKHGFNSEPGDWAIQRINWIHSHYNIRNEDFLFVLSTFLCEPVRWIERYGWRQLTQAELDAWFVFWKRVGERMNIDGIPSTYAEFDHFNRQYECDNFKPAKSNNRVTSVNLEMILGVYPAPIRMLGRSFVTSPLETRILDALGFSHPAKWKKTMFQLAMNARATFVRLFMRPRKNPIFECDRKLVTYGKQGFSYDEVGPVHLRKNFEAEITACNRQK